MDGEKMRIYIDDDDFKCHVSDDGTMTAYDVEFFDGKCVEFIEGYRYIPAGESWTRSDGVVFEGEMVSPWKPHGDLETIQREYELREREDMRKALNELGVFVDG